MNRADTVAKSEPSAARFVPNELPADVYEGVSLAPTTLESLVTWDVSVHARRDQERLSSAATRVPPATPDVD